MSSSRFTSPALRKGLTRGLFTAICLLSLLLCLFMVHLRLRLREHPLSTDVIYTSTAGGRCWMLKSAANLPRGEAMVMLLVEHPWPTDQPLMWSQSHSLNRPTGPTRAGKITILQRTDFVIARYMRWAGFGVGQWKDGTLLYDTPGIKADRFSPPMFGWSIGMPYWSAILLTSLLPLFWVIKQIQWAQQPKGQVCPECACDIPRGASRCPDCHLALGAPSLGTSATSA